MPVFRSKYRRYSIPFCIIFLMSLFCSSSAMAENVFTLGWEEWAPYQYKNKQGKETGLDVDLITAIMNNGKMKVTYKEIPWKRHLYEVEKGKTHMAGGASKTAEREKYAYYTDSYRTESVVLYIRKGEAKKYDNFKTLDQLPDIEFTLGVVNGYYYGEKYDELFKNEKFKAKTEQVNKEELNVKKLIGGRMNGILMDPVAATAMLTEMESLDKVEVLPVLIYSDDIYVIFSKVATSPDIVDAFNNSLKELKSNGEYDKIIKQYIKK